mmetsp:Transcript_2955/g.6447  ORF Transcript_2955/g.6447 Transcript_2955/m.6447 type:complete len:324 (-) Transcript_2955:69-1040(-)
MASPLPRPAGAGEQVGVSTRNFAFPLPVSMPRPSHLPAGYPVRSALPATSPYHNPAAAIPFGCAPQPIVHVRVTPAPNRQVGGSQRVTSTRRWQSGGVSLPQFIPAVEESRRWPSPRDQAYAAFLDAILSLGLLQDIPVAEGSRRHPLVRVSLPFCGALSEAPRLLPFLATHINQTPCALELHGCDIDDSPSAYWWPAWEEWTANLHGDRCSLCFQKKDLATERLPVAHFGLVLGIHPLVMGVGCEASWRRIMQNVLNMHLGIWHSVVLVKESIQLTALPLPVANLGANAFLPPSTLSRRLRCRDFARTTGSQQRFARIHTMR